MLVEPKWLACERVYSFVLNGGVSLQIGRYDGIALGHGIRDDPVLEHEYLGTDNVIQDLSSMKGWSEGYIRLGPNAVVRDPMTTRIVGLEQNHGEDDHRSLATKTMTKTLEGVVLG